MGTVLSTRSFTGGQLIHSILKSGVKACQEWISKILALPEQFEYNFQSDEKTTHSLIRHFTKKANDMFSK